MVAHRFAPAALAALGIAAPAAAQRVTFDGVQVLPTALVARAATDALRGATDPDARRRAAEAIEALYQARGYTLAHVVAIDDTPDGLRFTVTEGRIRKIVVTGNKKTRADVIRNALFLREGQVYRESLAEDDRARLARLRIFDDVLVSARNPDDGDGASGEIGLVDVVVRVKEGQTGNVAATVGYGDNTGFIGFVSLAEGNLLGRAERVQLEWQRWARIIALDDGSFAEDSARQAFFFSYSRPALGPNAFAWDASVYDQNTIFLPTFLTNIETIRNYERRRGVSAKVGRRVSGPWSVFVTGRRDVVGYDPIPERLSPPVDELAGATATVGALGLRLERDRRDRADFPRTGHLYSVSHEAAGSAFGGNRRFSLSQTDLRQYFPLAFPRKKDASLATRALIGTSSGDVPLSEKYFLGGFDLLRGYDFFSIRGNRMALASVEARIPMGPGLTGVVFVDHGAAWQPGQNGWSSGYRTGYGVGVRFASPLGPIRLDLAYGNRVQTYVSLGQAF